MAITNQRDLDATQILGKVADDLDALKANVISRWGRIPHVTADEASPPNGSTWIRSDDKGLRYRGNGTTIAVPRGVMGVHTLLTDFTTSGSHVTLQNEGLTLTLDEQAGRRIKVTLAVNPFVNGGANGVRYAILRDGVLIRTWGIAPGALSTTVGSATTLTTVETVAATHAASVFTVQIQANPTNTQVSSAGAGTGFARQLIIEDIGV